VAERRHLDGGDRVVEWPERAQRREQVAGVYRVAEVVGLDDRERLAAEDIEVQTPLPRGRDNLAEVPLRSAVAAAGTDEAFKLKKGPSSALTSSSTPSSTPNR